MPHSPEAIAAAIAATPFDLGLLSKLEEYARQQAAEGSFDGAANRHLLLTYSFHPDAVRIDVLAVVLMKALMRLPETDFLSSTFLVAERLQTEEPVKTVFKLAHLLESASYKKFWTECEQSAQTKALVDTVPGFLDAIRGFVAVTVESAYTAVPLSVAHEFLNVSDRGQLLAYADTRGWAFDEANKAFNTPETEERAVASTNEKISLDQVSKVLSVLVADM